MKVLKDFGIGIKYYFKAISFAFANSMGWYLLFPVVIGILLFIVGWFYVDYLIGLVDVHLKTFLQGKFFLSDYIKPLLSGVIWVFVKLSFIIFFSYLNGYVLLILLSPFLSYVSEKTEKILTGQSYPFNLKFFVSDVFRGISIGIRNFFYEMFLHILLLIIIFIPLVGQAIAIFSPLIIFLISSYFYGSSFIDYYSERRHWSVKKSIMFVRENKGLSLSQGIIFYLFLIVPIIGSLLSGISAVISTIAINLYFEKK